MCHEKVSRSKDALEMYAAMLKRIWEEELEKITGNLVEFMPRHVEAVRKAGGGHSKWNRAFKASQRCLIGLRSVEFGGHFMTMRRWD